MVVRCFTHKKQNKNKRDEKRKRIIVSEKGTMTHLNNTSTACGNVWKLLFLFIFVLDFNLTFPNTWNLSIKLKDNCFSYEYKHTIHLAIFFVANLHPNNGIDEKQHDNQKSHIWKSLLVVQEGETFKQRWDNFWQNYDHQPNEICFL